MNVMLVNNRVPGFLPITPARIAIGSRTPSRPRFSPPAFRPPALSRPMPAMSRPKMGQGGFSWSELPSSIALASGGVGGLILSGVLPSPFKEVLAAGGIGLIGWSFLNLFSSEAAAAEIEPGTSFPAAAMNDFNKVSAKIVEPAWNAEVNRGLFSADYDVKLIWTNLADKDMSIPYKIYVEETPQGGIFQEPFKGIAYSGVIRIPKGESLPAPLEIDLQHRGVGAATVTTVTMIVKKIAPSGQEFDAARTTFYVY